MKHIFTTLFLIFTTSLYAVEPSALETGTLLFIHPDEPGTVLIDGVEAGITPLLIHDITEKTGLIQIYGDSGYAEFRVSYNPLLKQIIRYSPKLDSYYGYVTISVSEDETEIRIDGEPVQLPSDRTLVLNTGEYSLSVTKEGFFPVQQTIIVPRLETEQITVTMEKTFPLTFSPELPENTVLTIRRTSDDSEKNYSTNEPILLSSGSWEVTVSHSDYETIQFPLEMTDQPILYELEMIKHEPKIVLSNLKFGSRVFLNDQDITESISDTPFGIPPGTHSVTVIKNNYHPVSVTLNAFDSQTHLISLEYKKNSDHDKMIQGLLQAGVVAAGGAVLASGMIMSSNDFLVAQTDDYSDYEIARIGTFTLGGTGLAIMITGTILGLITLFGE